MKDAKKLKRTKRADQNHKVLMLQISWDYMSFGIKLKILTQVIKLKQKRDGYE